MRRKIQYTSYWVFISSIPVKCHFTGVLKALHMVRILRFGGNANVEHEPPGITHGLYIAFWGEMPM